MNSILLLSICARFKKKKKNQEGNLSKKKTVRKKLLKWVSLKDTENLEP